MKPAAAIGHRLLHNAQLQMHFCVLLWGFTAILGKLISLPAVALVFWRVLIVSLCLLVWPAVWRRLLVVSRRDLVLSVLAGILLMLHWLTFYGAIKLANASVAVTSLALAPVFLAIAEPYLLRQAFVPRDALLALVAVPGVVLVVGGIPADMHQGFALGTLSALFVSVFSVFNKRLTMRVPALALTAIEMTTAAVVLGVLIPLWPLVGVAIALPGATDLACLLVLCLACTLLPFVLSIVALRRISAFSAQLAVNLEPVYTVAIASIALGERRQLLWPFYVGVGLLLASVLINGHLHRMRGAYEGKPAG